MRKTNTPFGLILLWLILVHQSYVLYSTGWSFFQNINLTFHEAGHTLFAWAPHMMTVFMGSGFEILLPFSITLYFLQKREYTGFIFGLWWTGTALWSAGVYIADALKRELPLIGNLDPIYHDWYTLLLEWKLLYSAELIGDSVYFLGSLVVLSALSYLSYMIYEKIRV